MKKEASIYDFARFCGSMMRCRDCPLSNYNNDVDELCDTFLSTHTDKVNEIVLKWCDENPPKVKKS